MQRYNSFQIVAIKNPLIFVSTDQRLPWKPDHYIQLVIQVCHENLNFLEDYHEVSNKHLILLLTVYLVVGFCTGSYTYIYSIMRIESMSEN